MHQKHTKLTKPNLGHFHRNEWSIIGTTCEGIQDLSNKLAQKLSNYSKVAYVDADHASGDAPVPSMPYHLDYTDKIHYHQFKNQSHLDTYQFRWWLNEQNLVLINGNHFPASRQIVIIDPKKEESLKRKLDRLSNVQLILLTEKEQSLYPFLEAQIDNHENIPTLQIDQIDEIAQFLLLDWQANQPELNGLVLAGGKSKRMGEDKGAITYHGKPQREYTAELLDTYCIKTFISCTSEQKASIKSSFPLLTDKLVGLGPFGAIASAFQYDPNKAWLVVACDLPLLDHITLEQLISQRNPAKLATTFQSPVNELPEPLITIWEPRSYPVLMQFLTQGYSCPRKVLVNSDVEILHSNIQDALKNVNTPEEKLNAMQILKERQD